MEEQRCIIGPTRPVAPAVYRAGGGHDKMLCSSLQPAFRLLVVAVVVLGLALQTTGAGSEAKTAPTSGHWLRDLLANAKLILPNISVSFALKHSTAPS